MDPRPYLIVPLAVACFAYSHSLRADETTVSAAAPAATFAVRQLHAMSGREEPARTETSTVRRNLAARNAALDRFNQEVSQRPVHGFMPGNTAVFCVPR